MHLCMSFHLGSLALGEVPVIKTLMLSLHYPHADGDGGGESENEDAGHNNHATG